MVATVNSRRNCATGWHKWLIKSLIHDIMYKADPNTFENLASYNICARNLTLFHCILDWVTVFEPLKCSTSIKGGARTRSKAAAMPDKST